MRVKFEATDATGKVHKRREEIAELIGVTVGSLQVTCSRLGISLRRPRLKPVPTLPSKPAKTADVARFAISMQYRGEERTHAGQVRGHRCHWQGAQAQRGNRRIDRRHRWLAASYVLALGHQPAAAAA